MFASHNRDYVTLKQLFSFVQENVFRDAREAGGGSRAAARSSPGATGAAAVVALAALGSREGARARHGRALRLARDRARGLLVGGRELLAVRAPGGVEFDEHVRVRVARDGLELRLAPQRDDRAALAPPGAPEPRLCYTPTTG